MLRQRNVVQTLAIRSQYKSERREMRRLKLMNLLSPDFTGEAPAHQWIDPKRLRMVAQIYQEQRNKHRMTFKVDDKDKQIYKKQFDELGAKEYVELQRHNHWLKQYANTVNQVKEEADSLPYHLRQEVINPERITEENEIRIGTQDDYMLYYEQFLRLMPEEEARMAQLTRRIFRIAFDKLISGE